MTDVRPEIRDWIEGAGLRVKAFYRVSELAQLLGVSQGEARRYVQSGAIDAIDYADRLPGSRLVRVTLCGIEQIAAERGITE